MSDHPDAPQAPLLVPDAGYRDGVHWDGWRVVLPTDTDYGGEYAAALHVQRVYGEPVRYATEDDISAEVASAEVARRTERTTA